jgi:predicted nucleotidyltransferase
MTEIYEERVEKYRHKLDREEVERRTDLLKQHKQIQAVLLYGSRARGTDGPGSNTDLCVVAPELKPSDTMSLVWRKPEPQGEELDIRAFQELSLEAKHSVIKEHEVLWKRNGFRLGEFLHTYRKLWNDTSKARGVA